MNVLLLSAALVVPGQVKGVVKGSAGANAIEARHETQWLMTLSKAGIPAPGPVEKELKELKAKQDAVKKVDPKAASWNKPPEYRPGKKTGTFVFVGTRDDATKETKRLNERIQETQAQLDDINKRIDQLKRDKGWDDPPAPKSDGPPVVKKKK